MSIIPIIKLEVDKTRIIEKLVEETGSDPDLTRGQRSMLRNAEMLDDPKPDANYELRWLDSGYGWGWFVWEIREPNL